MASVSSSRMWRSTSRQVQVPIRFGVVRVRNVVEGMRGGHQRRASAGGGDAWEPRMGGSRDENYWKYKKRYSSLSPYEALGLKNGALIEDVKTAYRNRVKLWHPDVCKDEDLGTGETVEQRFLRLQAAYELLSDEETKRTFDDQHRDHPYAASKSWRSYLDKRKKAFAQAPPGSMTQWQVQQKRERLAKRHTWEQNGDFDKGRKMAARQNLARKQKIEAVTRMHYLACRKRDKDMGEDDEETNQSILELADEILREEEGMGFLGYGREPPGELPGSIE